MSQTPADLHFVVVHAVPGITALPSPTVSILSDENVSVSLTTDPLELFTHVDRQNALSRLFFTGGIGDTLDERFATALAEARSYREQQNAWIVTDARMSACLEPEVDGEFPEFSVSINNVSDETREDIKKLADSAVGRVTVALSIILGEPKFSQIKRVATSTYSCRPGNPKPTYQFQLKARGVHMYVSSPADQNLIDNLRHLIGQLPSIGVETALRLHKATFEEVDDHLRSFVAAWASLEIFVNKVFCANFNLPLLSSLGLQSDGWEGKLHGRLKNIEVSNLGIEDRFAFLSIWLSRSSAEEDTGLFARLNSVRNDIYHRGIVSNHLRNQEVISLFRRYVPLLLSAIRPSGDGVKT
jgi:hypothetical protein